MEYSLPMYIGTSDVWIDRKSIRRLFPCIRIRWGWEQQIPAKKKEKGPTGPYPDDQLGPIIDPKRNESKVGPEKLARCRWGGAHVVSRRLSDVMRANPGLEVRCAVCYYVVVPTCRIIYAIGVGEGPLNKWPEHLDLSLSGCQDLAKPQLAHSTSMSDAMRRADTVNCSMAGAWRLGSNAIAPTVNER